MHSQQECQDYCTKDLDATVACTMHSQHDWNQVFLTKVMVVDHFHAS